MQISILVVDDSRLMRKLVIDALRRSELAAMDFTEASSGAEALELLRQRRFDLIVSDWHMPEMDGAAFIDAVRRLPAGTGLPVMVASSDTSAIAEATAPGRANVFIKKPFTKDDVARVLGPVLGRQAVFV